MKTPHQTFESLASLRPLGSLALFFSLGLLLFSTGCRLQPWQGWPTAVQPGLVWPPPPETARVAFVMQIRAHQDLFESGGFWRTVGEVFAGRPDSSFVTPSAVAIHPAGGLLVADRGRGRVHFYNWARRRYIEIGPKRKLSARLGAPLRDAPADGLPQPVGVAALPDGRILVSDSTLKSIEAFDETGKYLGTFAPAAAAGRPVGLAVNPALGELYVADVANHAIKVFDFNGKSLRSLGRNGEGEGEFNFPTHLTVDGQGRLVVTDSMNWRIQILQPDGTFVRAFGKLGDAPGAFSKPKGVAVDGAGNIIVVEGLYDALQFFDDQGRLLLSIGMPGNGPGQFWLPAGLFYDPAERLLFVADQYNRRIQVFRVLEVAGP